MGCEKALPCAVHVREELVDGRNGSGRSGNRERYTRHPGCPTNLSSVVGGSTGNDSSIFDQPAPEGQRSHVAGKGCRIPCCTKAAS